MQIRQTYVLEKRYLFYDIIHSYSKNSKISKNQIHLNF